MTVGLIGLIFILLAVFLISNSLVSLPGTAVQLPRLTQVKPPLTVEKMIVTVSRDSELFFNGSRLTWEEFEQQLSERVLSNSHAAANAQGLPAGAVPLESSMVVVCADQDITLGTWFRIADIARKLGLDAYLATEPSQRPQPAAVPANHVGVDAPI